ncbi:APC family permease [Derxia lacustris]|uniref:APC family permease n=1 Tax=Derxia lacustris TaxID=764842 RepID=UPI000A16FCC5|nr:APC family permease [Derxia lacustris]
MNPSPPLRQLGVAHAASVCVGMVIGAGIFKTAPLVAANVGSAGELFALWAVGGLVSLIGALCFAELAAAFPDPGGDYWFLRLAWGRRAGFAFAWSRFAVIHTGSMALLAFVLGDYANALLAPPPGLAPWTSALFAAGAIGLLVLANLRGLRVGIGTQLGLALLVLAGLGCVIAAGVWVAWTGGSAGPGGGIGAIGIGDALAGAASASPAAGAEPADPPSLGTALVFVFLAYGGWSDAATLSAEMRDPRRGMLRALLLGMGAVTALYLATVWAYWRVLGLDGLARSSAPAADTMRVAFGRPGEIAIVGIVALASLTVMNAILIAGARTTYAAARDSGDPAHLGEWHPSRAVPQASVLAIGAVALLLVALGSLTRAGFETMVDYLSPVYWGFLVLSGLALPRLRRRLPQAARPFRVPGYPWLPLLFAAASGYVLWASLAYVKAGALAGVGVVLAGLLLRAWMLRRR